MSLESIVLVRTVAVALAVAMATACCLLVPRWWATPLRWVLVLLVIEFLLDTVGSWTAIQGVNNSVMFNLYQPFELVMLLLFFGEWRPGQRKRLWIVGAVGLVAWGVSWVLNDPWAFLLTDAMVVTALLQTGVVLVALWDLAETSEGPLLREPYFWFFLGLFAYFGGLFPIIGPLGLLQTTSPMLAFNLYLIISVLAVLRSLLTATSCLLLRRRILHEQNA